MYLIITDESLVASPAIPGHFIITESMENDSDRVHTLDTTGITDKNEIDCMAEIRDQLHCSYAICYFSF
jgi:hypothetical protein